MKRYDDIFSSYKDPDGREDPASGSPAPSEGLPQTDEERILAVLAQNRIVTHLLGKAEGATMIRYDLALPPTTTIEDFTQHGAALAASLGVDSVTIYSNLRVHGISVEVPRPYREWKPVEKLPDLRDAYPLSRYTPPPLELLEERPAAGPDEEEQKKEVSNRNRSPVGLCSLLSSGEFARAGSLSFAVGKDAAGNDLYGDLARISNLLVGGASGSGKSVFLRCLLVSLLMKSPEEVRLILFDPKKAELCAFRGIPHLLFGEILESTRDMLSALNWAVGEAERRYSRFLPRGLHGAAVRDIAEYNQNAFLHGEKLLPHIVIVIDELAYLMREERRETEELIARLTPFSRAAGIHLVAATLYTATDVLTDGLKQNFSSRACFYTATPADSGRVLGRDGAEKLLRYGDMLYRFAGMPAPCRAFTPDLGRKELEAVLAAVRQNDTSAYETLNLPRAQAGEDPEFVKALAAVVKSGTASIAFLQRRCGFGYNRAAEIIKWLEKKGYVSEVFGNRPRIVLMTKEEFEAEYGPLD